MEPLYYISNNLELEDKLGQYFANSKIRFEPYNILQIPKVNYLLVLEPYKLNDEYYHIHTIWRDFFYLSGAYPELKLIVVGFTEIKPHPNYVNLFNFKENLELALNSAEPIKESWQMEINYDDIKKRLEKFFLGHDRISLSQKLNDLQQSVKNINYVITGKIKRPFEEAEKLILPMARQQFKDFRDRWKSYNTFFTCCPFDIERKLISGYLDEVKSFFESNEPSPKLFQEVNCLNNIQYVRDNLIKMDKYVRPEIYRQVDVD